MSPKIRQCPKIHVEILGRWSLYWEDSTRLKANTDIALREAYRISTETLVKYEPVFNYTKKYCGIVFSGTVERVEAASIQYWDWFLGQKKMHLITPDATDGG